MLSEKQLAALPEDLRGAVELVWYIDLKSPMDKLVRDLSIALADAMIGVYETHGMTIPGEAQDAKD